MTVQPDDGDTVRPVFRSADIEFERAAFRPDGYRPAGGFRQQRMPAPDVVEPLRVDQIQRAARKPKSRCSGGVPQYFW